MDPDEIAKVAVDAAVIPDTITEPRDWTDAAAALVAAWSTYFGSPSILNHQKLRLTVEQLEQML
jgi:hypothetical protein